MTPITYAGAKAILKDHPACLKGLVDWERIAGNNPNSRTFRLEDPSFVQAAVSMAIQRLELSDQLLDEATFEAAYSSEEGLQALIDKHDRLMKVRAFL